MQIAIWIVIWNSTKPITSILVLIFCFFFSCYLLDGFLHCVVECHHHQVSIRYVLLSHPLFCLICQFPVEVDLRLPDLHKSKTSLEAVAICSSWVWPGSVSALAGTIHCGGFLCCSCVWFLHRRFWGGMRVLTVVHLQLYHMKGIPEEPNPVIT